MCFREKPATISSQMGHHSRILLDALLTKVDDGK